MADVDARRDELLGELCAIGRAISQAYEHKDVETRAEQLMMAFVTATILKVGLEPSILSRSKGSDGGRVTFSGDSWGELAAAAGLPEHLCARMERFLAQF